MTFIIANWKSNGSLAQVRAWCREVADKLPALHDKFPQRKLCIVAPYVFLPEFATLINQYTQANKLDDSQGCEEAFSLAAQDLSAHGAGAYTGEIHSEMLKDFSCGYVLIGHSERRALFNENESTLSSKLNNAVAGGLVPIFCLGEDEAQREANETESVIQQQLEPVKQLLSNNKEASVIVAYEPVWAIGTGKAATPDIASATHSFIKAQLAQIDANYKSTIPVIYGGSVKPDNAAEFMAREEVDGLLVGGASLEAASILQIFSI